MIALVCRYMQKLGKIAKDVEESCRTERSGERRARWEGLGAEKMRPGQGLCVLGRLAGEDLKPDPASRRDGRDVDHSGHHWVVGISGDDDGALDDERGIPGLVKEGPRIPTLVDLLDITGDVHLNPMHHRRFRSGLCAFSFRPCMVSSDLAENGEKTSYFRLGRVSEKNIIVRSSVVR